MRTAVVCAVLLALMTVWAARPGARAQKRAGQFQQTYEQRCSCESR